MHIRNNIQPGDIGAVIWLHGTLYGKEFGLDHTFEGYVASRMGQFAETFDPGQDHFAVAEDDGRIVASIAIDGQEDRVAQLRWFLVSPECRGQGVGRKLLHDALEFCRAHEFRSVILWTISDLKVAAHLYRDAGFQLIDEKTHEIWGAVRTEQRYELVL